MDISLLHAKRSTSIRKPFQSNLPFYYPGDKRVEMAYMHDSGPSGRGYFLRCHSGVMYHLWRTMKLDSADSESTMFAPQCLAVGIACPEEQLAASYKHMYDSWQMEYLYSIQGIADYSTFCASFLTLNPQGNPARYKPGLQLCIKDAREAIESTGDIAVAIKLLKRPIWDVTDITFERTLQDPQYDAYLVEYTVGLPSWSYMQLGVSRLTTTGTDSIQHQNSQAQLTQDTQDIRSSQSGPQVGQSTPEIQPVLAQESTVTWVFQPNSSINPTAAVDICSQLLYSDEVIMVPSEERSGQPELYADDKCLLGDVNSFNTGP
ncbi:hypothetical protein AOQ84DRAFT_440362 [Glonium stellatum]|uniref:Uncharacterized protein n=1 Tax=Glonium stellatum TaxID=574774 RepID=A0A8E2EYC9_9PEZI|nr:hypothetical protein AOQ84DRAFT_440362 [Glonium stellatum]